MPSDIPPQTVQPIFLVWLAIIAVMWILFRFVNRWARRRFPWLYNPGRTLLNILLVFAALAILIVVKPPPSPPVRKNPNQATAGIAKALTGGFREDLR
jgi:hypothetical protein